MDQLTRLEKITGKVNSLISKQIQLGNDNASLKEENQQLQSLLKERNQRMEELENHLKVLKLAKQVSNGNGNDTEKVELKRKINEFIKEIDKCVALLNN